MCVKFLFGFCVGAGVVVTIMWPVPPVGIWLLESGIMCIWGVVGTIRSFQTLQSWGYMSALYLFNFALWTLFPVSSHIAKALEDHKFSITATVYRSFCFSMCPYNHKVGCLCCRVMCGHLFLLSCWRVICVQFNLTFIIFAVTQTACDYDCMIRCLEINGSITSISCYPPATFMICTIENIDLWVESYLAVSVSKDRCPLLIFQVYSSAWVAEHTGWPINGSPEDSNVVVDKSQSQCGV